MDWTANLQQTLTQATPAVAITLIAGLVLIAITKIVCEWSSKMSLARAEDSRARVEELKAINVQVIGVVQKNAESTEKMSGAVEMVAHVMEQNTAALMQNTQTMQMLVARIK